MTKRLFIFAGYDRDGIVDDTLLYYLNHLSGLGDIVFTMDTDLSDGELAKIQGISHVLHATAKRHGEYDFGSYKRGYAWARDNKLLNKYDWVYLVNDSVFGPLFDLTPALNKLETSGADFTGAVRCTNIALPNHIQSWFVGLKRKLAASELFNEFISNINHQNEKSLYVFKYEMRMTQMLQQHGFTSFALADDSDAYIYGNPYKLIHAGLPFLKKLAVSHRHQIQNLYSYTDMDLVNMIIQYATRHGISLRDDRHPFDEPYNKHSRLTIFSIPVVTVYRKCQQKNIAYKICLFDKIPVCKFTRTIVGARE